jgi:hypothetical protein
MHIIFFLVKLLYGFCMEHLFEKVHDKPIITYMNAIAQYRYLPAYKSMQLISLPVCIHRKKWYWKLSAVIYSTVTVVSLIRCILTKKYLWLMVVFFMKKSCSYWKLIVCYGLAIVALLALCYLQTEHCLCLFDKCTYVLPCALCIW